MIKCIPFVVPIGLMSIALPLAAHPGPEPHPTVEELNDVAANIRSDIKESEQRLSDHINRFNELFDKPIEELVKEAFEAKKDEFFHKMEQEIEDLKKKIENSDSDNGLPIPSWASGLISGFGGGLLGGLGAAWFAVRTRQSKAAPNTEEPRKTSSDSNDFNPQKIDEVSEERSKDSTKERPKEEDKEHTSHVRVVTQTLKDSNNSVIKALCNPTTEWSPRRVEDAIVDIRERNIVYISRGPMGNETDVEVHERNGKRFLKTKADEHGGNNLSELPDPT